jgi:hypothetical protein
MQSTQHASNHPTPSGNAERIPDTQARGTTTEGRSGSRGEDSSNQAYASERPLTPSPVRLPERAEKNTMRYCRCPDYDSWWAFGAVSVKRKTAAEVVWVYPRS